MADGAIWGSESLCAIFVSCVVFDRQGHHKSSTLHLYVDKRMAAYLLNTQSILHYFDGQPAWLKYALTLLAVVAATLAARAIPLPGGREVCMPLLLVIILSSFWLGIYPGIFALVLSLAVLNAFFLRPVWQVSVADGCVLNLGFCVLSACIMLAIGPHRRLSSMLWETRHDMHHAQAIAQTGCWRLSVLNKQWIRFDRNHRLFGIPEGKPMDYETFLAVVHPDDRGYVDRMWHAGRAGEPYDIEHRLIVAGKVKWVREKAELVFDKGGNLLSGFGITQDITERKLVETALRDQENELRLIMDATPALISYLDTGFRYLRVNATYQDWFCLSPENILGREAREIIGEQAWVIVYPRLEKALAGERVHFDQLIPYRIGKPRWVQASYIPHQDENGAIKGIVVHIVDIEERKQAEQKIALLNQRLQQRVEEMQVIFNTVPIGLAIAEDSKGQYIRSNPANERMLGLTPQSGFSMRGEWLPAHSVMHDGVPVTADQLPMQRAVRGETILNQMLEIARGDGQMMTVICNASPLFDAEGAPRGAVAAFMDITDYMKSKELSLRRDKMEQAFRISLASQTVAAIAHELNQPLTAIASYADVALKMLQTEPENRQKITHVLESCVQQAQRAGQVIRQLLNQLQQTETVSEPIDINSLVNEALDFVMKDQAVEHDKIELDLMDGLPPVLANALQIQKVLINLIRNGLESMQEHGHNAGVMRLTTRLASDDPDMLQVTVCDSGKGVLDTAELKSMFQPFYTTKPDGLGMGLAISRALIRAHGGNLWAESNSGTGLSVHFTLPFQT